MWPDGMLTAVALWVPGRYNVSKVPFLAASTYGMCQPAAATRSFRISQNSEEPWQSRLYSTAIKLCLPKICSMGSTPSTRLRERGGPASREDATIQSVVSKHGGKREPDTCTISGTSMNASISCFTSAEPPMPDFKNLEPSSITQECRFGRPSLGMVFSVCYYLLKPPL